jgi:anti-sigma-K factor RskA
VEHEAFRELSAPYALDALDAAEERTFEEHLARCAECRADVTAFRETAASLAHIPFGPAPSTALRERIVEQARGERSHVVPLRRRWALPAAAALAAAASIAAIGLGIWGASLSSKVHREQQTSAEMRRLIGVEGSLLVTPSGQGTLVVSNLERAPQGKTYEAWVIEGGKPRPAGTFAGGQGRLGIALTRSVPAGAIVAVTLERAGGARLPTSAPIFRSQTV